MPRVQLEVNVIAACQQPCNVIHTTTSGVHAHDDAGVLVRREGQDVFDILQQVSHDGRQVDVAHVEPLHDDFIIRCCQGAPVLSSVGARCPTKYPVLA